MYDMQLIKLLLFHNHSVGVLDFFFLKNMQSVQCLSVQKPKNQVVNLTPFNKVQPIYLICIKTEE